MATGIGWWYQSSKLSGRWVFLGRSSAPVAAVTLTDVNQDGRCDVIAYNNGSTDYNSPTLPLITSPGAQTSSVGATVSLRSTTRATETGLTAYRRQPEPRAGGVGESVLVDMPSRPSPSGLP
jgi:hypothetical protein